MMFYKYILARTQRETKNFVENLVALGHSSNDLYIDYITESSSNKTQNRDSFNNLINVSKEGDECIFPNFYSLGNTAEERFNNFAKLRNKEIICLFLNPQIQINPHTKEGFLFDLFLRGFTIEVPITSKSSDITHTKQTPKDTIKTQDITDDLKLKIAKDRESGMSVESICQKYSFSRGKFYRYFRDNLKDIPHLKNRWKKEEQ